MLLWIVFLVLTAASLVACLWPLVRSSRAPARAEFDKAVYKDQLAEIDADLARGLISANEAEAARTEILRRLLASEEARTAPGDGPAGNRARLRSSSPKLALYAGVAAIPLLALPIYLTVGAPDKPDQPLASRVAPAKSNSRIASLIARVEKHLDKNPGDGKGWDVLAPVYLREGRFQDAKNAFARAVKILGPSANRLLGMAEAGIFANKGIVAEEERKLLDLVLRAEPKRAKARFWIAMSKEQDGKLADAAKDYGAMLADAPAGAPWRKMVSTRLAFIRRKMTKAGMALAKAPAKAGAALPGPTPEDVRSAGRMSKDDRAAMINQMVAGLAERLSNDGGNVNEWSRLIRSYVVLNRRSDAKEALARARKALKGSVQALEQLDALERRLKLKSPA